MLIQNLHGHPRYAQAKSASAGAACGCEAMLRVLARRGGPQATSLIAEQHTDVLHFSERDWMTHMAEEETILADLVAEGRFPRAAFDRIVREHRELILPQIRRTGTVDPDLARAHAKFEDDAVEAAGLL